VFLFEGLFILLNGLRYTPAGRGWAGVDSVWEQKKLEARKMLAVGVAESPASNPCFVGHFTERKTRRPKKDNTAN
jgi:hypothetical protein